MNTITATTNSNSTSTRNRIVRRLAMATTVATLAVGGLCASQASAGIAGQADVVCNTATNTIEVTPRVVSDWANDDQWAATRIWIGKWDGAQWRWATGEWKIEVARSRNSPIAQDVTRLAQQTFSNTDGYHYVYVESFRWDGRTWYGQQWQATTSYTVVTPSVSHVPTSRTSSQFCTL